MDLVSTDSAITPLVDTREHRFQLTVVGALVLAFTLLRRPTWLIPIAAVTAFPVLPSAFRRLIAPRLTEAPRVEDRRLPAFARVAGGAGLALAAVLAKVVPSRVSYAVLGSVGGGLPLRRSHWLLRPVQLAALPGTGGARHT